MDNDRHTRGPWHWWAAKDGRPKDYDLCKLIGFGGENVLTNYGGEGKDAMGTTPERRANAALIASAPDLLAALKDAVFLTGFEVSGPTDPRVAEHGEPAWVCRARAAIAKAQPKVSA